MTVYLLLVHADNHGREVRGIYSTKKKAERAVLKIALDDKQPLSHYHIAEVEVDVDQVIDWMGPQ